MASQLWTTVDEHIASLFVGEDEALDAAMRDSVAAGLPQIAVSAAQGKALNVLARAIGARRILEIGTLGGYSTIWLARALPQDGKLITLEASSRHAEVARRNIARAGLAQKVEVRLGAANKSLAGLISEQARFDLIFIDANKDGYPEYLDLALQLSHIGTLIIADNVVRRSQPFVDAGEVEAKDANAQGIVRFNEKLAALGCGENPRVTASILQTVGAKGHDGLAIAVVLA